MCGADNHAAQFLKNLGLIAGLLMVLMEKDKG
jgi:hypothetical protein